ncbi:zinc finger protein 184 isoform X2 [Drosophila innubila]|uniref:zinc finger protein 184 isoform X2 n=1 Tax=Drosophila innubila TaxID=198719 RepID=UPI00148B477F|nr:zinc finger protein 184 isoform X2 [Drosophila innubila]
MHFWSARYRYFKFVVYYNRRRLISTVLQKGLLQDPSASNTHSEFVDVSSHTDFPKNPDVLKSWLTFCRKNNNDKIKPYQKSVICNEHFKEEDIQGGLQFQMGLCSKRTLRPGAVPCINKNDMSEAERENSEKRKNKLLVAELLEEAEAREAAEASGEITIAPDFVRNTGIVSVPDFVSATGNAFVPFTPAPTDTDPLAEEQSEADISTSSSRKDVTLINKNKCRTCSRPFVVDENAKDLCNEENAVMLYHIEVITGIWIQCNDEISRFMCSKCVDKLRTAIEFREICIRTELLLTGGDDVELPENDMELCDSDKGEAQLIDHIKEEEFISVFPGEEEDGLTTVIEPLSGSVTKKIGQVLHPAAVDSSSLALGAQIYEDLLNEYLGKEKKPRPKQKTAINPNGKEEDTTTKSKVDNNSKRPSVRQRQKKPGEPAPKRTRRTKEEKNRIRREQIRAMPLNHVCDQCGASFRVRCNLTIHMLRHTHTKNYECPECPKKFYDAYMRNMHIRVRHKGELPFVCNYCPQAFSSSNTRYLHEKNVHGASPRIHRNVNKSNPWNERKASKTQPDSLPKETVRNFCMYCDKSYATKYALNGHINQHLGLTPYKCKKCDMRFATPQAKKKHEMRHDSKRPFECDICLKGFYTRTKLKEHERIHTGERPYRCDLCDAYFRYKFNLHSHQFSKMHKDNLKKAQSEKIIEDSS